jgi:hypothetical protein
MAVEKKARSLVPGAVPPDQLAPALKSVPVLAQWRSTALDVHAVDTTAAIAMVNVEFRMFLLLSERLPTRKATETLEGCRGKGCRL